jgi:D-cysteine desulfhydrase
VLFQKYPRLAGKLPRVPLTRRPTPVEPLPSLGPDFWIKRDDRSGDVYGGNKPRKLEFIFGDLLARGSRSILTFGGIGSHHALACALCGRAHGIDVRLIAVEEPRTPHVLEMFRRTLDAGVKMDIVRSPRGAALTAVRRLAFPGRGKPRPRLVMPGASTPLGCVGFVEAALEVAAQVRAGELPEPAVIAVPVGSMGTAAGLLAGLTLTDLRSRVLGVVVNDLLPISPRRVLALAAATLGLLRKRDPSVPRASVDPARLRLPREWLGAGYGHPTPEGERARAILKSAAGIELEDTYTGKTLAAVLALREAGDLTGPILFWNTFSSAPLRPLDALPPPASLPPEYRRYFDAV